MGRLTLDSKLDDAIGRIHEFFKEFESESGLDHVDYRSCVRLALRRYLSAEERKDNENKNSGGGG